MIRAAVTALLLATALVASAQTTDGSKSRIPKAELAKIRKTKFRVVVPTYVPAGFTKGSTELFLPVDPQLTVWSAKYRDFKTKRNFVIQMASDGLGDPMFDLPNGDTVEPNGSLYGKSPILGKFEVMFYKKGNVKMAHCTWYEVSKKGYPRYAMVMSDGMEPSEVKKIIESLRWLK